MKKTGCRFLLGLLGAGLMSTTTLAQSQLNLNLPQTDYLAYGQNDTIWLAAADSAATAPQPDTSLSFTKDNEGFQEPWFTGSKAHQYFGLGALALVALAAISPKEEDGAHEYFAKSATVLAAAAATSGLIYHWEDFDFSDGFTDPDNLHMMLGALGTLAMMVAISEAPDSGHAGFGILGGVAMGVAVKIEW